MGMFLAQLITALFMGTLIDAMGSVNVVIVASFIGVGLATMSSCLVVTKETRS